ncbi:S8 family peptidase [Flavobacterium lipolyticum]|uniref:S8 family peptidase n=1 Tax=Flavobacterium lipolyticum TaxID=2893754 RepID=A0ABS8M2B2_9FLAO|nr:S8 family peptidase [Flavobacterium sp. F-126]MCC9018957.1 S8 family peptidase [Flavobacterium sp. F-126]
MAQYLHLFLPNIKESIPYTSNSTRGPQVNIPDRDVASHSQKLTEAFEEIWKNIQNARNEREAIFLRSKQGTYLEFKSSIGFDLITKSLEDIRQGVRLLNIRQIGEKENEEILCTVYVPSGKESFFLKKVSDYADTENLTIYGKPKNQNLINSINDVKIAFVESLWTDPIQFLPDEISSWCEIWLRHNNVDAKGIIDDFLILLSENRIEHKTNYLNFPERAVLIVKVNRKQLSEIVAQTDYLAEIRIAQETAGFWTGQSNRDQQEWVEDLLGRLQIEDDINVRVCILDSGVNNGHSLLAPVLEDIHCLTVRPSWLTNDHESGSGHGTLMSGIAAYNNIEEMLESSEVIILSHKLCSVKIIPPPSQEATPMELWGDITSQAINRTEINLPNERIVYCMAITSVLDIDKGRPSSWSGAIDNIAFSESAEKLIIISAGNVVNSFDWDAYPESNLTCSVQNPAQSWNSLVVGAYTEKIDIKDSSYHDYVPVASKGQLSPFSSTSSLWEKKWPIKPDVVFEGGNILRNESGDFVDRYEDFGALSTSKNPVVRQFDTINATSAATAKASWMAAKIMSVY